MWRHALIGSKLALFCLVGGVAIACVQTYETDLRGKPPESDESSASEVIVAHLERGKLQARLKKLKIEFESSSPVTDYKERNDYAVVLMSLGETEKAIEILKSIESERPNEYNTAANLGTAFELHGDLASALDWIKIGIERNRQAHRGTE
jgi:tetratricopeptide (TPR) repeat protein